MKFNWLILSTKLSASIHRVIVALMLMGLAACDDGTNDINEPPTSPVTVKQPVKAVELPPEFNQYRDSLARSERNYVKVIPEIATDLQPTDSKFRGQAFLPAGHEHPLNKDGERLALLAQINWADMPSLPGYPSQGILQIHIDPGINQHHVWGMNSYRGRPFEQAAYFQSLHRQDYFKVLYFPHELVNGPVSDAQSAYRGDDMPITGPMKLHFELATEWVNAEDYRFAQFVGQTDDEFYDQHEDLGWEVLDAFYRYLMPDAVAKIGGYGRFVQEDPRTMDMLDEDWLVLLNIESASVGNEDIMWGDGGTATFFIRRQDLANLDFSQVAYYWDNH
ncbi:YwqG family protein [Marinicella meishanensis]|uniref:YwqG family protein n=1 Tax=Marinicella meishanensis TaxID=2873263 RepID=UPI001CC12FAC|nr:DUF1963 domain-containing protein [Marinicella sp. NBU2979]